MRKMDVYKDHTGIYLVNIDKYDYTQREINMIEKKVTDVVVRVFRSELLEEDGKIAKAMIPTSKELHMGITKIHIKK